MEKTTDNTWVCLSRRPADLKALQKNLKRHGIHLRDIPLKQLDQIKQLEPAPAVLVIISKALPKKLPPLPPHLVRVWLCQGKLPTTNSESVDFGLSFKEFERAPAWYTSMIYHLVHDKMKVTLGQTFRDSVIEKLNAKSTLLEQLNERLKQLTVTDDLTGVYNHRHFRQILEDELDRAKRYQFSVSLLMIDVDYFKAINDTYGHLIGDKALIAVAQALKSSMRRADSVCRYGGEEFTIILPMTALKPAQDLAERLRQLIARTFPIKSLPIPQLTVSIGVASYPNDAQDAEGLLNAADQALYQAKHSGRNCVATAQPILSS